MKANAPEKIWVHELSAKELNVPLKEYHVEYVRSDAFIEKACEWLNNNVDDYWRSKFVDSGAMVEGFRKYMKGE